jgi:hypothetical protein
MDRKKHSIYKFGYHPDLDIHWDLGTHAFQIRGLPYFECSVSGLPSPIQQEGYCYSNRKKV